MSRADLPTTSSEVIIQEIENTCPNLSGKIEELEQKLGTLSEDVNRLRTHMPPRNNIFKSRRSDWELFHNQSFHRIVISDCNGIVFAGGTDLEVGKYNGKPGVFIVKVDTRQYFRGLMAGDRIHSINGIIVVNEALHVVLELLSSIQGDIGLQILRENVLGTSCRWFCSINQKFVNIVFVVLGVFFCIVLTWATIQTETMKRRRHF